MKRAAAFFLLTVLTALAWDCRGEEPGLLRLFWPPPPDQPRLEFLGVYASQDDFPKTRLQKLAETLLGKPPLDTFKAPFGIVADGRGKVYVADSARSNVAIYDLSARKIGYLFRTPLPVCEQPLGLATDGSGNLYVADGKKKKVLSFTPSGAPLRVFGDEKTLARPEYLAVHDRLGRLYVADAAGHRIAVFSLQGEHLFSFGRQGAGAGEFRGPHGLAFDPAGRLYVADTDNARLQAFDPDGGFLLALGGPQDETSPLEKPRDLAFDSQGHLHVVDQGKIAFITYSPQGELLLATGASTATTHRMGFFKPVAIHIGPGDRIYLTDGWNRRFAVWQYLNPGYLAAHPVTAEDLERLTAFIAGLKSQAGPPVEPEGETRIVAAEPARRTTAQPGLATLDGTTIPLTSGEKR